MSSDYLEKIERQSQRDNPEALSTLSIHATGRKQTKRKTQHRKLKGLANKPNGNQ